MKPPVALGVAGLGVVGCGLIDLIRSGGLAQAGTQVRIAGVCARTRDRDRPVDVSGYDWFDDPIALARDPGVEVFVELMGGAEGPTRAAVETALGAGKPVVTANKALVAEHGDHLARLCAQSGAGLYFEAAIMAGTPIVRVLRDGLAPARVRGLRAVLNGTCNFILSEMSQAEAPFDAALARAQALGFAEADPSLDVGGGDAAQKLAILASLAFGGAPDLAQVSQRGITGVRPADLMWAHDLGLRLKSLAQAQWTPEGVRLSVAPTLLAADDPLAGLSGAMNGAVISADPIGEVTLLGVGAGAGATALGVGADIVEASAAPRTHPFGAERAQPNYAAAEDRLCDWLLIGRDLGSEGALAFGRRIGVPPDLLGGRHDTVAMRVAQRSAREVYSAMDAVWPDGTVDAPSVYPIEGDGNPLQGARP
ncbi:MAG: homoserine dehydrogenase [Maricaulaceae bacterium]